MCVRVGGSGAPLRLVVGSKGLQGGLLVQNGSHANVQGAGERMGVTHAQAWGRGLQGAFF